MNERVAARVGKRWTRRSSGWTLAVAVVASFWSCGAFVAVFASESADALPPSDRVLANAGVLSPRYVEQYQEIRKCLADLSRNDRWSGGASSATRDATLTKNAFFAFCVAGDQGEAPEEALRLLASIGDETDYKFSKTKVFARYLAAKHLLNDESRIGVASRAPGLRNAVAATTYTEVEAATIDKSAAPFLYVCASRDLQAFYRSAVNQEFKGKADFFFNRSRLNERVFVACNPRLQTWIAWTTLEESETTENFYWIGRGSEYWGRYRPRVEQSPEEWAATRRALCQSSEERKERERALKIARNAERRERAFYRNEARRARHNAILEGARPLQARSPSASFGAYYAPPYEPSLLGGDVVHVDGYFRRDGTYVRPHTRSWPTRD